MEANLIGGTVTHAETLDTVGTNGWDLVARVWLICSNLTVGPSGKIDVTGKGYPGGTNANTIGYGPGGGTSPYGGAAHGGYGGCSTGLLYGSETAPTNPGSGGCGAASGGVGADGGGVIRVEASGTVTVNGSMVADGEAGNSWHGGGASGGSVWLTCRTVAGSGTIRAAGGNGKDNGAAGGGGCVVVDYNEAAQAAAGVPALIVSAAGGLRTYSEVLTAGWQVGDLGTLRLPDNQFLAGVVKHSGKWISPAARGEWALGSLTLSNGWIRFPASGGILTVTNNVLLTGGATLDLGGNEHRALPILPAIVYPPANFLYSAPSAHAMRVGGDLILTNAGTLRLFSAATNGTDSYGLKVSVTGTFFMAIGCTNWMVSHWTNGGSCLVEAQDFILASGAVVMANQSGFGGGLRAANAGYGPGSPKRVNTAEVTGAGAGYGGNGGAASDHVGGPVCGSTNAPSIPGSGGDPGGAASSGHGGIGGGLVRIISRGKTTLNGTILANGMNGYAWHGGGGSGGGIWIVSRRFEGRGLMRANGGDKHGSGGSGGGGRIAVWYNVPQSRWADLAAGSTAKVIVSTNLATYTGSYSVNPGIAGSFTPQAAAGSAVFLTVLQPPGTIMAIK